MLLALCHLGTAHAQTSKRVALLIGNADYQSADSLKNPPNDVRLVADAAKKAGFRTVTVRNDIGVREFHHALREFREQADGAEVAMVYYAGHGIEANGRNWLIPTDAALADDRDLPGEAIELNHVMDAITGATLRLVVLDACRNNPFGRSWRKGGRAVGRGLAQVEADDVLVIYAAAPGQVAADGAGNNSPFATALAKRIVEPGLPVQMLGGAIRDDVLSATGGKQRPFVSASITGAALYLVRTNITEVASATSANAPEPIVPSVQSNNDVAVIAPIGLGDGQAENFVAVWRRELIGKWRISNGKGASTARAIVQGLTIVGAFLPMPLCEHFLEVKQLSHEFIIFAAYTKKASGKLNSLALQSITPGKITFGGSDASINLSGDGTLLYDMGISGGHDCQYARVPGVQSELPAEE